MKVVHRDLRHGIVKVKPESFDDLWYLTQIIASGDSVSSSTTRRIKEKEDSLRSGGGERKTIKLTLDVEKTELKAGEKVLRVSGTVVEGPMDLVSLGSHHTLGIEAGEILSIKKMRWLSAELERLKDAVESTLRPAFIVAAVEEGEAAVGLIKESGIQFIEVAHNVGGKYDTKGREDRRTQFHSHLLKALEQADTASTTSKIILCGPGFYKNEFQEYIKSKNPGLAGKTAVENTGSGGRNAVKEVLNRPIVQKISGEANAGRDVALVQRLLAEVGRDTGLASYGLPDVRRAAEAGAVETLLASTEFFVRERKTVDRLLRDVKNTGGSFHIVNSEAEAGRELDSLGGVAALLRYRIQ